MRKALAILALTFTLVSCDQRVHTVELPPAPYDKGPTTAYVWYVGNPDTICETFLGDPGTNRSFRGCYLPMADMIVMPSSCDPEQVIGQSCKDLLEHEKGHARGWRHAPKLGE